MSRKPRKPKVPPLTALPPEGSPGDWYARGWRDGALADSYAIARDFRNVEDRVKKALAEMNNLYDDMRTVALHLSKHYGIVAYQPERWELPPTYMLGASEFTRRYAREFETAPPERPKPSRRRKARPAPASPPAADPGPTLTLGDLAPPAEPEGDPEAEADRAEKRAWRA